MDGWELAKGGEPRRGWQLSSEPVARDHNLTRPDKLTMNPTTRIQSVFRYPAVLMLCLVGLTFSIQGAEAPPPPHKIDASPVTSQMAQDYSLPPGTQVSGGLLTVGVGQPVYLEALINHTLPLSEIANISWALTDKPLNSSATLTESPLGMDIPIYSPGDREVFEVGSRTMLRPDKPGQYTVTATVFTNGGSFVLTRHVTAAVYMGANSCALCHSGGAVAPDKFNPWLQTGHATAFSRAIDGQMGAHFSKNCVQCHTLGYDTNALAVNGGFDDVAAQHGWTFPASLTNGNWAAMPQALREVSNVQCENCHGPGYEHAIAFGNTNLSNWPRISVSFSAGDCAQCHEAAPYHIKSLEWNNSRHAIATRYPTGENREACVRCHSGIGFVDYVNGRTPPRTQYEAITCAACHDPHSAENPHQLRVVGDVVLADGTTVTNGGTGKLCMSCHLGRDNAATYVESAAANSRFGPHHSVQTDMLFGVNAVTYGKLIPSSAHAHVVKDGCVTCHLQETSPGDPAHLKAGGHTFRPGWDGGTPDNPADDVHLTGACVQCHGPVESFNFAREDYDGDGVIEGVQEEVKGLLEQLGNLLPPDGPAVEVTASYTRQQLRAAFNYKFVENDGSFGVHNVSYAVGLLKASIADLTDDADRDGLSDQWEILYFGSIHATDGNEDSDHDGMKNALELAAGTNPNLADSDGDGFNDLAEMQAGSDPLNAEDVPGLLVHMHGAGELEFASQLGETYQIQMVTELSMGWQTISTNIPGTGGNISHLVSTRNGGVQAFYRVVKLGQ